MFASLATLARSQLWAILNRLEEQFKQQNKQTKHQNNNCSFCQKSIKNTTFDMKYSRHEPLHVLLVLMSDSDWSTETLVSTSMTISIWYGIVVGMPALCSRPFMHEDL